MSARDIEEDARIAIHEAGHAVIAVALAWELGPVTIAPGGEHYGGLVLTRFVDEVTEEDAAFAGPLPLMPGTVRRKFETAACVFLAGGLAEDLRADSSRWSETLQGAGTASTATHRRTPERAARQLPALSRADATRVAEEAQQPGADDLTNVWTFARALAGSTSSIDTVAAFVRYAEAVTRDLLARSWADVERLAAALLEHRTLSGEAARLVIAGAPDPQPQPAGGESRPLAASVSAEPETR